MILSDRIGDYLNQTFDDIGTVFCVFEKMDNFNFFMLSSGGTVFLTKI